MAAVSPGSRTSGILTMLGAAGLLVAPAPVLAQDQGQGGGGGNGGAARVCEASVAPLEEGGEAYLQVVCGTRGVILGQVDAHELIQVPSLRAAVAVTTLGGTKRAWLIMVNDDESVALEEITGTIARLGGRGARRDITGLDIEIEGLNTGQLTALVRRQSGDAVSLDIAAMVARSREVRGRGRAASEASDASADAAMGAN